MLGTWGIKSINSATFNQSSVDSLEYPKLFRDIIYSALKVRNLFLNILGYLSATRFAAGCTRISLGVGMLATVMAIGNRRASQGMIIGRFYDETVSHAMAQIARGIFEAFVPYGYIVNGVLDVVGTVVNLSQEFFWSSLQSDDDVFYPAPHPNPDFPIPLSLLHLV
jgi:hypothetical protein